MSISYTQGQCALYDCRGGNLVGYLWLTELVGRWRQFFCQVGDNGINWITIYGDVYSTM